MPAGGIRWERKEKGKTQSQRRREKIASVARDEASVSQAKDLVSITARERDRYPSSLHSETARATDAADPEQRREKRRDGKLDEISRKEAADRIWLEQKGFVALFPLTQTASGGGTANALAGGFGLRNSVASPSRNSYSVDSRFVARSPQNGQSPIWRDTGSIGAHSALVPPFRFGKGQFTHEVLETAVSPRYYRGFSGLERPRNSRQQGIKYPSVDTPEDSGSHNYSTQVYEDNLYSTTSSIYASFPEHSPPPPNPFLQATQQRCELANIFCTWADYGFTPNFLPASASYKDSSTTFGPSSTFNIGQQPQDQGLEPQSHFADTQLQSRLYIGQSIAGSQDFQDPTVRQSLANQLEVTSTLDPRANSFHLERYKDLGSTLLCPPQVPVANRSLEQLEVTSEPQMEATPEVWPDLTMNHQSRDEHGSMDRSSPLPASLYSSAPIPEPVILDPTLWLHVQVVRPPPVDLSDSSSQFLQYEQYIKTTIEPQVTKYIMSNTAMYLPCFSSVSTEPTMSLEVLRSLTPAYCQKYSYFLVRLDRIARGLKALSVDHPYWKAKQNSLIKDVEGNHAWMRRKMEERVWDEAEALKRKRTAVLDGLMGSPKADKEKGVDKGERTHRDSNASNTSNESHTTSSSMDSSVVRGIEGGIYSMFDEDDEDDCVTLRRWDDERAEAEKLAEMDEPQTPDERNTDERQSGQESLERYITASTTPIEVKTPTKTAKATIATKLPTPPSEQSTAMHPNTPTRRFLEQENERLARVGWVGKETEDVRRRKVRAKADKAEIDTPARSGIESLLTPVSMGSCTGTSYERTWTNLPPTPSPAPRASRVATRPDTRATSHLQFGDVDQPEGGKEEKESTHPYIAKSPPRGVDVRMQLFYARLAANHIRTGSPAPTATETLETLRPVVKLPAPRPVVRLPRDWPILEEAATMGGSRCAKEAMEMERWTSPTTKTWG